MTGNRAAAVAGSKRKRESGKVERRHAKSKVPQTSAAESDASDESDESDDPQTEIAQLEAQVLESRKHYNNIATLMQLAKSPDQEPPTSIFAAVSLCRIFTALLATKDMMKSKGMSQSEALVASWLRERYREYTAMLLNDFLRGELAAKQSAALTLLMRLVKEESEQPNYSWKNTPLPQLVEYVLLLPEDDATRDEFAEKYFTKFDDVRFYTFQTIQ